MTDPKERTCQCSGTRRDEGGRCGTCGLPVVVSTGASLDERIERRLESARQAFGNQNRIPEGADDLHLLQEASERINELKRERDEAREDAQNYLCKCERKRALQAAEREEDIAAMRETLDLCVEGCLTCAPIRARLEAHDKA